MSPPGRLEDMTRAPDASSRGGAVVSFGSEMVDDGEIRLGPVRLEPLSSAEEAQAVELLAVLFAAAASRRGRVRPVRRAA